MVDFQVKCTLAVRCCLCSVLEMRVPVVVCVFQCRFVIKYGHSRGQLIVKMTDDREVSRIGREYLFFSHNFMYLHLELFIRQTVH